MAELIEALKARRIQVIREMEVVDKEAAQVRQESEARLALIRQRRLPMEERLRRIDALIEIEQGDVLSAVVSPSNRSPKGGE